MTKTRQPETELQSFPEFLAEVRGHLDRLQSALFHLAHIDDVFWQVQAILHSNTGSSADGAVFQDWMAYCYADSMAVGLRRLVDSDERTFSLYRLLQEIKARAGDFTRQWYVESHPMDMRRKADRWFSELVGGAADRLSRAIVETKQKDLADSFQIVKGFVDQFVAHTDIHPTAQPATFSDIRQAVVSAFGVLQWSGRIIDSTTVISPVPVIQANWLRVFRTPWLSPGQKPPAYEHLTDLLKKRLPLDLQRQLPTDSLSDLRDKSPTRCA